MKVAILPVIASLGGVVVPALIFLTLNRDSIFRQGWAIATATDIGFATGVLALLGRRVPPALRTLLLAIAVFDDLVAVLLIALAYSARFDPIGLSVVALGSGALYVLPTLQMRGFISGAWPLRCMPSRH